MRARTVLAAVALAGTVLLGGGGLAFADDNDDMSNFGADFGSGSPGASEIGQGGSPSASEFGHGGSGLGQSGSALGQGGSIFDRATGNH